MCPIYSFECQKCHKIFDIFEDRNKLEHPNFIPICPDCKNDKCEKVIAPTSFVLNGGGWAKDGYSGKGGKNE